MPLSESQSGVASITVSKEGGNSDSGRDRPTRGGGAWPKGKKIFRPPSPKKKKEFFLMVILFLFLASLFQKLRPPLF